MANLQPRKNLAVLFDAYRAVRSEGRLPHRLVVIGQRAARTGPLRS